MELFGILIFQFISKEKREIPLKIICHNDTRFTRDFAQGARAPLANLYETDLDKIQDLGYDTVALTGLGRLPLILELEKRGMNYFFIDRGYVLDDGRKEWLRISYNAFQMQTMSENPIMRKEFKLNPMKWNKKGENILVIPPCAKAGKYWGFDKDEWLEDTVNKIKKYSNREIVIRQRPAASKRYSGKTSLKSALKNTFIIVVYNSNAATEAIYNGTPALVLGDAASKFVSITKIKNIENPIYPDRELWLRNLLSNQFKRQEVSSGKALKFLMKIHDLK